MTNNPNHPLKNAKWKVIPTVSYLGVLVTKTPQGYTVLNLHCEDEEGVDEVIEQSNKRWSERIKNQGAFNCTNTKG